jgi:hypothetical protein
MQVFVTDKADLAVQHVVDVLLVGATIAVCNAFLIDLNPSAVAVLHVNRFHLPNLHAEQSIHYAAGWQTFFDAPCTFFEKQRG